jgi:hypothetical protein
MRLSHSITSSKGVATVKEITPLDYVLVLNLAIAQFGNVSIDEIEEAFWLAQWLEQQLIVIDGEFTEAEFADIVKQFKSLNSGIFETLPVGGRHVEPSRKPISKKLKEVAQSIQTDCAILISRFNYQAVFSYGFQFIQHLQQLHK